MNYSDSEEEEIHGEDNAVYLVLSGEFVAV